MEKKFTLETLVTAIKSNDITKVKDLLVTNRDALRFKNLYGIIEYVNDVEMFSTLFHGCGKEIMDSYEMEERTILNHAILIGKNLKIIQSIINLVKDSINCIDGQGETPLMCAVSENRDKTLVKLLLENNANVNICNKDLEIPLHCAKKLEVLKLLIDYGAWVNVGDKAGNTPIISALKYRRNKEIILELIKNGANVDVCNSLQESCLHLALYFKYDEDVIIQICCKTFDYNLEDYKGFTPLCYAVDDVYSFCRPQYRYEFLCELIKKGFVVNTYVIMYAVERCKNIDFIEKIIKYGDIRCIDKNRNCLLHHVKNVRLTKILARRGSAINHENNEGRTPLMEAIFHKKDIKIIESLLFWGSDTKKLECLFDLTIQSFDHSIIISDSVYDVLILYGMNVSLKNNFIKRFLSCLYHSSAKNSLKLNYGFLRHIFLSNENVMIPEDLQTSVNVKDLFKSYISELNRMKEEIFTNNLSYYNFCTKQYRSIRSQNVYKVFTKADYEKLEIQFPIFFNEIAVKIKINIKMNKRKELLEKLICIRLGKRIQRESHSNNDEEDVRLDYDSIYIVCSYMNEREISCLLAASII